MTSCTKCDEEVIGQRDSYLQPLMIEGSSDKLRDAWIGKSIIGRFSPLTRVVSLRSTSGRATNTDDLIKSEQLAIPDSAYVFGTDTVGTETIAESGPGKRLCLPAGRASGQ